MSLGAGIAGAGGGGLGTPGTPELTDLLCIEKCAGARKAAAGSRIQLTGRDLGGVTTVLFASQDGGRTKVDPSSVGERTVEARVPRDAATGRVKVVAYGEVATTPRKLRIVSGDSVLTTAASPALRRAEATPRQAFFDGKRAPRVRYLFEGGTRSDVQINVVNRETKETVATFTDRDAEPNSENTARWDGLTSSGRPAPNGEYRFVIGIPGSKAKTTADANFGYYKFRFPIIGRHTYGDGFGAGRGHQGQDVFARCGKPIVAARGGRIQWNKHHGAAGNYVVVDAKGTKSDFMYAHLQKRSPLGKGQRVKTGQLLGRVGDTGNASGCHLHFEVWSGPGWYEGGDPLPSVRRMLKAWDGWS